MTASVRWEEKLAMGCIAAELGVAVEVHDDGSAPSMYDLNILYPDRAPGAVEVTAAADPESIALGKFVYDGERWIVPGITGGWTATLNSSASEPSATPTVQDIMELEKFAPLEPGTYFIDPDSDPSTPLRVVYEVPYEGWSQWFGALKFAGGGHVMINITTVVNVVRHGCRDHSWADPPVGPSVDDLAVALADLAPFRVTSAPKDVTMYGYRGKHLELAAPHLPAEEDHFPRCDRGNLLSWVAPIDVAEGEEGAFHGYNGQPIEEFWILDVDGTRLVIEANWSSASAPADVAEMRAILNSIRVEL